MESMSTLVLTVVGHATDSQGPRDQGPLGESVMDYSYISCRKDQWQKIPIGASCEVYA